MNITLYGINGLFLFIRQIVFNAGGKDSIIEIGAVKMKDGMILERYDELINPGVKLEQKIIDVTSITLQSDELSYLS